MSAMCRLWSVPNQQHIWLESCCTLSATPWIWLKLCIVQYVRIHRADDAGLNDLRCRAEAETRVRLGRTPAKRPNWWTEREAGREDGSSHSHAPLLIFLSGDKVARCLELSPCSLLQAVLTLWHCGVSAAVFQSVSCQFICDLQATCHSSSVSVCVLPVYLWPASHVSQQQCFSLCLASLFVTCKPRVTAVKACCYAASSS